MDPFTHAVLGAIAGAGMGRAQKQRARSGKKDAMAGHTQAMPLFLAALIGAVAGLFPDIDIITYPISPLYYDAYWHRTYTHSAVLAPLWALILSALVYALLRHFSVHRQSFKLIYAICLAGIATHIFGDVITAWGVGVLLPLSEVRLSLGWIFVIDPIFSLTLVLLLCAIYRGWDQRLTVIFGCLPLLWLGMAGVQKQQALALAQSLPGATNENYVGAWPQPLSIFNWKLVRQDDEGIWSAHVRTTERAAIHWPVGWLQRTSEAFKHKDVVSWRYYPRHPTARAEAAWERPEFGPARDFMTYPVYLRQDTAGCHWFTDLLFVIPTQEPPFQYAACQSAEGHWEVKRGDVSMPWQS